MASPVAAEEHSNTKSEEGTTAFHQKRSRRVSFAENTSVHIFDRDEEVETPPDSDAPSSPYEDLGFSDRDGEPRLCFENEEEDNEDEDMDELGPRSPFFKVVRSPSSGGSTIGSVTSNDEDNFFGPVSAKFIRRDLSDSVTSDGNHDQTMDSTAFSMHFNSLARSDSEADLKTSTRAHLSFEEKTPTFSAISSDSRSHMLLTLDKNPSCRPDDSTSKFSTGSQSNDMSLVGEYHDKYDYGMLSPPLLAEAHSDLHVVSHISGPKPPLKTGKQSLANKENESDLRDFSYDEDNKMQGITSHEELNEVVSVKHNDMGMADDGYKHFPNKQIVFGTSDTQASKHLSPNQSDTDYHTVKTKQPLKDPSNINPSLEFMAAIQGSLNPKNMLYQSDDAMEKENKYPFADMAYHMLLSGVSLLKSPGTVTPSHNQSSLFITTESQKHGESFSVSSLQKSISKLRILEVSPFSAAFRAKLEDSNSKSLLHISKMTPLGILEKSNKSSVNKELYSVLQNDNVDPIPVENVQSSSVNQLSNKDVVSATRKRKTEDMMAEKIARIKSSLRFFNDNVDPLPVENVQSSSVNQLFNKDVISATRKRKTEDMMAEKFARIKWSSRFFKETKLLSHPVDKMNLRAIGRMVDILEQLQRSKTYELLSNEIQSPTILDPRSNIREKRAAETRLLLCKIVHEKAKLQLMQLKRERLLKNVQSLASEIQDSEALKFKYSPKNLLDAQVIHHQTFSKNTKDIQECLVDHEKVSSLREAIKDTDRRISDMVEAFNISFKMKQEASPTDTVAFVNNHLMKRARCQIIRKDLQLWVIEDLKGSKDHRYLVLNYLDLMTQRFTVTPGLVTKISVSYILKETNISKNFKDMDALTAFRLVFSAGSTKKHIGYTNLAHETQMTCSRLGNLVDVMEEIQLARFELKNLIHARWHIPSDEQLHLELYFFDSITRKKATVTLNTSCLKRGIYPSEILSYQIDIQSQNSSSSSLSDEIVAEIKDLRVGFLRILRLCKCISQVISHSR